MKGWVIFHEECRIVYREHSVPLTDPQEHRGSGQGSWRSAQDQEAPARQRMDHPDILDLSYPPANGKIRQRLNIILDISNEHILLIWSCLSVCEKLRELKLLTGDTNNIRYVKLNGLLCFYLDAALK